MVMNAAINEMAKLVGCIGSDDFERIFYDVCGTFLQADQCTVFSFDAGGVPNCVIAEGQYAESRGVAKRLAKEYVDGAYRMDPTIAAHRVSRTSSSSGLPIVRSVSPSAISDPLYRQRFYDEASVRQELALIASVDEKTLYCSFYRNQNHLEFNSEDSQRLAAFGNFLAETLNKHVEFLRHKGRQVIAAPEPSALNPEKRERMYEQLRASLLRAPGALTQREAEICASIALGYTALGISLNLGISINTVATHRKRAYAKLGISCQNELFARYFDSMGATALALN